MTISEKVAYLKGLAEGGGFAAAGGSQQRHKLFVMDVEVQPIQNALTIKVHYDVSQ